MTAQKCHHKFNNYIEQIIYVQVDPKFANPKFKYLLGMRGMKLNWCMNMLVWLCWSCVSASTRQVSNSNSAAVLNRASTFTLFFPQARRVFIVERYLQCQSYLKCQGDLRISFPKTPVPEKSTVFRSVLRSCGTGSVSDRKSSGYPTALDDESVENIRYSLV